MKSANTIIEIAGIAVDLSGNLVRLPNRTQRLQVQVHQAGTSIEDFKTPFKSNPLNAVPHGIAVDSTGAIYKVQGN